jgi:hypothetical protein
MLICVRDINVKLNPNKCIFATRNIRFLGHVMSKTKMMPNLPKVRAVSNFLVHVFTTNVCAFLDLTGYAKIIAPLFELIKPDVEFRWTLI